MSNDDRLRTLYRRAAAAGTPDSAHPDEAAWERLACGESATEERSRLLAHLVECEMCADIYRVVSAIGEEAGQFDAGARTSGVFFPAGAWAPPRPRWTLFALAASVSLIAVLTAVLWRGRSDAPDAPTSATPSLPALQSLRRCARTQPFASKRRP